MDLDMIKLYRSTSHRAQVFYRTEIWFQCSMFDDACPLDYVVGQCME